jgi:hypothetical protein
MAAEEQGRSTPGGGGGTGLKAFHDTGYFYISIGDEIVKKHGFNQIPTRFTMFFSNVLNPNPLNPQHFIYLTHSGTIKDANNDFTGIRIRFTSQNEITIEAAGGKLIFSGGGAYTEGYLRILMWR